MSHGAIITEICEASLDVTQEETQEETQEATREVIQETTVSQVYQTNTDQSEVVLEEEDVEEVEAEAEAMDPSETGPSTMISNVVRPT